MSNIIFFKSLVINVLLFLISPQVFSQDMIDNAGTAVVIIDDLSIREKPDVQAKVIVVLKEGDKVDLLAKTRQKITLEIRKEKRTAPWYKISTPTGKIGWVFGGGISQSVPLNSEDEDIYAKVELVYDGYDVWLENGKKVKLSNILRDDEPSEIYYWHSFINPCYVFDYHPESTSISQKILVNKFTGKITEIKTYGNRFIFSPDNQYFINAYSELGNGFQIWTITDQAINLFYEAKQEDINAENDLDLQFQEIRWLDNKRIEIHYHIYSTARSEPLRNLTQIYTLGEKLKLTTQ
jgi:hypothetical protein